MHVFMLLDSIYMIALCMCRNSLSGFLLRFVKGGNKFAIASGCHLVMSPREWRERDGRGKNGNQTWQSLKSALFLTKKKCSNREWLLYRWRIFNMILSANFKWVRTIAASKIHGRFFQVTFKMFTLFMARKFPKQGRAFSNYNDFMMCFQ